MKLDISNVDIPTFIAVAVNQAWPIGLGANHENAQRQMTVAEAVQEWAQEMASQPPYPETKWRYPNIDYLWGRRLKLEFEPEGFVDATQYDSVYGEGALAKALAAACRWEKRF